MLGEGNRKLVAVRRTGALDSRRWWALYLGLPPLECGSLCLLPKYLDEVEASCRPHLPDLRPALATAK